MLHSSKVKTNRIVHCLSLSCFLTESRNLSLNMGSVTKPLERKSWYFPDDILLGQHHIQSNILYDIIFISEIFSWFGKSHCVHTERQFEQYPFNIFQFNLVKFRLRGLCVPALYLKICRKGWPVRQDESPHQERPFDALEFSSTARKLVLFSIKVVQIEILGYMKQSLKNNSYLKAFCCSFKRGGLFICI